MVRVSVGTCAVVGLVTVVNVAAEAGVGPCEPYEFGPIYEFGFERDDDFTCVVILDEDNDGVTWEVSEENPFSGMRHARYESEGTPDDWLVSIPFLFEAGEVYRAGFWFSAGSPLDSLNLELFLGPDQTAQSMVSVFNFGPISNIEYNLAVLDFSVAETGVLHFGLQVTGGNIGDVLDIDANFVQLIPAPGTGVALVLGSFALCRRRRRE